MIFSRLTPQFPVVSSGVTELIQTQQVRHALLLVAPTVISPTFKRFSLVLLLLAFAGVALFALDVMEAGNASGPSASRASLLPKVIVKEAVNASVGQSVMFTSTVQAQRSLELYAQVEERTTSINFKAQQRVKRGDLLVQQDDREEQLALKLAQVNLANAQRLLERYRLAVQQGAVPQTQVDSAQADFDSARVAVEQATLAIARHKVIAPFSGVIGISNVDLGQRVGPGVLIATLDAREAMYVDIDLPEQVYGDLSEVPLGKFDLRATVPAVPGVQFRPSAVALDNRLVRETRTIRLRANIDNTEDFLRPGMSVKVELFLPDRSSLAVPEISLQWDRQGAYVWIIEQAKAKRINLDVKSRRDGVVFVLGKLKPGDLVVVEGGLRLAEGKEVEIVEDPLR